jgi:hypothetical protein
VASASACDRRLAHHRVPPAEKCAGCIQRAADKSYNAVGPEGINTFLHDFKEDPGPDAIASDELGRNPLGKRLFVDVSIGQIDEK